MSNDRILNMCFLAAAIPPILCVVGEANWLGILPVALVCAGICMLVDRFCGGRFPRWFCALEWVWLCIYAGAAARESGGCWEGNSIAIPVILLLLAGFASQRGDAAVCRMGMILFWLAVPVLSVVALAGVTEIHPHWISASPKLPNSLLTSLLLIPCLVIFLPQEVGRPKRWLPWIFVPVAVGGAGLLESVLGSKGMEKGFYEFSKGITLLGVAERFEALVACALTFGWFALLLMIFRISNHLAQKVFASDSRKHTCLFAAGSAAAMCILPEMGEWSAWGALIFWGFLPLITQGLVGRKKVVKK